MSAGEGCEAVVTANMRCRWIKFRECGEFLYERFPPKLKGADHMSNVVSPAILHESEVW